jgi:hypothetical protein
VTTVPVAPRAPAERRIRRRERLGLVKATGGVFFLLVIAGIATLAAVHTIANIANPDTSTRLERYAKGKNHVVVHSADNQFEAAFPDTPTASTEIEHVFIAIPAQRLISTVGADAHDTVQIVWYSLPKNVTIRDPQSTLTLIAATLANDLHGSPGSGERVLGTPEPAYEYTIIENSDSFSRDYHVRLILSDHEVYELRVESNSASVAVDALHTLAGSFRLLTAKPS